MSRGVACVILGVTAVFAVAPQAAAHAGGGPLYPEVVWHHWNWDPVVWIPLLVSHWLYGRGLARVQARARGLPPWRVWSFIGGEIVLVVALMSPLDPLGETLLSAHMVQHMLLTVVAPPLLLLGRPHIVWLWGMPRRWRRLAGAPALRPVRRWFGAWSRPITAALVHGAVMWLWHAPFLFEAALDHGWVHKLEHVSFFATAVVFWRAMLNPREHAVVRAAVLLLTFMHSGMLGGLLSFAPVQIYTWYGGYAHLWGMSALTDQQIAGLVMWAPGGAPYLVAFAFLALSLARSGGDISLNSNGIIRASTSSRSMK